MTASVAVLPTRDELVTTALTRLDHAMLLICLLGDTLTPEERHPIRNDLHAVRLALRTPPLRPEETP